MALGIDFSFPTWMLAYGGYLASHVHLSSYLHGAAVAVEMAGLAVRGKDDNLSLHRNYSATVITGNISRRPSEILVMFQFFKITSCHVLSMSHFNFSDRNTVQCYQQRNHQISIPFSLNTSHFQLMVSICKVTAPDVLLN